ncbi:MAG TPA: GNAT family N-acetyltransferase [Solirubrobacteraceae bacterium]|nr:GNAT family N-acetyltransferase [Solirubrobacteraceae bacterium]
MSSIRRMERGDLDAVAGLYERVVRSGSTNPAPGLRRWFERTLFDHPWVDPELPSLVALDRDGRVVGMICSHARRLRIDGESARLAVSGQLVVAPEARRRAAGALLLRSYLSGPQDLTITDGATAVVRGMWERLGGDAGPLQSVEWWRPLRPWRSATAAWRLRRRRRAPTAVRAAADALDRLTPPFVRSEGPPRHSVEALTSGLLIAELPAITRRLRLAPDYDVGFAEWLLAELAAVNARGELRARLVRDGDGRTLGYFVYYLLPGEISPVIAIAAQDEDTTTAVLDALLHDALVGGASVLHGRVEPRLLAPVAGRGALLRYGGAALLHASNPLVLRLADSRHALLTRLEGEWWMGPHLDGEVGEPQVDLQRRGPCP